NRGLLLKLIKIIIDFRNIKTPVSMNKGMNPGTCSHRDDHKQKEKPNKMFSHTFDGYENP
ncbi:hypothetical protein, partial [Thermoactinomyces intermedius]|uniref:hypothetical protein n=1 Tax=Thermoactinomyces intermedius TaxID=2024 RepID=UPI001C68EBBC